MVKRRRFPIIKSLLLFSAAWVVLGYIFIATSFPPSVNVDSERHLLRAIKTMTSSSVKLSYMPLILTNFSQESDEQKDIDIVNKLILLPPPTESERPGEMGQPVELKNMTMTLQMIVKQGWKNYGFNQYVSDMISVHRTLHDFRDKECVNMKYPTEKLPPTSVIICFYNEAWSVLLRTVHSVLDRSPEHLITEIILVDDYSNLKHLNESLERYMSQFPKVKIVRATKREGLIRARLLGTSVAQGPVLTYLDSHCECTNGWLEPLLYRIYQNKTHVVCPVIDVIDHKTFAYQVRNTSKLSIGGFDWDLRFRWHSLPARIKSNRSQSWAPLQTPTIAGGLFSIDKSYFEHLGKYDEEFDVWGGENLELSFKVWMCGGSLEIIPCSRVGHVFRDHSPYSWELSNTFMKKNSVRLAKVWMDDYAKYHYERLKNDLGDYGNVTSRIELRNRLNCKSFEWYLKDIYPEIYVPNDVVFSGEIRSLGLETHRRCIDASPNPPNLGKPIDVRTCHGGGGNQYWTLTTRGEIRRDETCIEYNGRDVVLNYCFANAITQLWSYHQNTSQIQHKRNGKCMEMNEEAVEVFITKCSDSPKQKWLFQSTIFNSSRTE